jgi:type II secretory pathway component GspD/PulD (secretin)
MLNFFAFKNITLSFVFLLSVIPLTIAEETVTTDFNPFESGITSTQSKPQTTLDQSPIIPQLALENSDISEPFQIISDSTGWSIFPTTDVGKAKVTLFAKDISAQQLLDAVVTLAGFIYHREDDIITVMTYDEYVQFYGLEKEVVNLSHARAESITSVIKPFLSKLGKSVVHTETNTIVLFESPANLKTIVDIIEHLDIPAEAETIIKVIDLNYMDAEVLAETLQKVFSEQKVEDAPKIVQEKRESTDRLPDRITEPPVIIKENAWSTPKSDVGIYAVGRTNQLIVKSLQSDMVELEKLVEKLDTYVEPTTKSYHLTYVDASEIYEGLEEILDIPARSGRYGRAGGQATQEGGRPGGVTLVTRTNSIVLTAPPSVHRVMTSIVESIDTPGMYEAGMIRIYKIENADVDEVAGAIRELIGTDKSREEKAGEPKFREETPQDHPQVPGSPELEETEEFVPQVEARVAVSKSTNSVIIQATAREQREFEKLIKELDVRRKQVLIKAVIIEVNTNDDTDIGVELDLFDGDFLTFTSFGLSAINPETGVRDIFVTPGGTAAVLRPNKVQGILKALEGKDNVRIESAPQVLVNDNAAGVIRVIAEEPTKQTNQGQTTTTTSFGEYVTAGTQFIVTPHISEGDYLRVEYQIILNSFGEQADPDLPPSRNTSTIQSEATVPDNYTIVVGGIQATSESESVDKVPLLGDIPLLGLLFRNTATRKKYITSYLFITTTIMESESFEDLKDVSDKAAEKVHEDDGNQTSNSEAKGHK